MDEFWKALPSIVQAVSIAITAFFAVKSLQAWRIQLLGKRRIEIAEEALVAAYRANSALEWIRNPMSFSNEASERPKVPHETEQEGRSRDTYFVPFKRIKDTSEDFVALGKVQTLCRVYFGNETNEAIQELFKIRHEVSVAARMLTDKVGQPIPENMKDFWDSMEMKIWATEDEDDKLTPRAKAALKKIVEVCEAHLK